MSELVGKLRLIQSEAGSVVRINPPILGAQFHAAGAADFGVSRSDAGKIRRTS